MKGAQGFTVSVDCPLLVLYCFIVYPVTGFVVLIPHDLFISSMHVSDVVGKSIFVIMLRYLPSPRLARRRWLRSMR